MIVPLIIAATVLCFIGQATNPLLIAALLGGSALLIIFGLKKKNDTAKTGFFRCACSIHAVQWHSLYGHGNVGWLDHGGDTLQRRLRSNPLAIRSDCGRLHYGAPRSLLDCGSWSVTGVSSYVDQRRWIVIGLRSIWASFALSAIALQFANLPLFLLSLVLLGLGLGWQNIFIEKIAVQFVRGRERDRAAAMLPPMDNAASAFGAALAGLVALNISLINPDAPNGLFTPDQVQSYAPRMTWLFFAMLTPVLLLPRLLPKSQPRRIV